MSVNINAGNRESLEFDGPPEQVIPNQSEDWCGNLHRISGYLSSYRTFFCTVFWNSSMRSNTFIRGIATKVVRYFIAMTGNSPNSN